MTNYISEFEIQKTFHQWCLKQDFILFSFHVPNGLKSTARNVALLKQAGLRKGVPDYWVILKNKKILAIEFKTEKGELSEEQNNFIKILNYCGIPNEVCRSAHEAVQFVKKELLL